MVATVLSFIKLFFAILLLPAVYFITTGFFDQVRGLKELADYFLWGGGIYILFHLFFRPMQGLHAFGQKIISDMLKPSPLLATYIPMVVPVIPTVLLLILYIFKTFADPRLLTYYFLFAIGFTLAMHIVITAHLLYEEDNSALRTHYLFLMSLFYILNILIIVILLQLIFPAFHIGHLVRHVMVKVGDIYGKISNFLFHARPQI